MTIITQIDDRCAALAWSPISSHADIIALGTKDSGGVGFNDYGGELEFFHYDSPQVLGNIKTTSRFSSIGWTSYTASQQYLSGIIGGGMADGTVMLWDPSPLLREKEHVSLISSFKLQQGAVTALKFNPHAEEEKIFATGGTDGQVLITSLERVDAPETYFSSFGGGAVSDSSNRPAMITNLAWNSQVSHIVASATGEGTVAVWDVRQKKKWCEIRCEHSGVPVSDLAWNPTEGLHMVTACSDDRFPILKLWDLRASTSVPLAQLEGHTAGALSLDWCPNDATMLLSSGKDGKTFLWDLCTLKPIYEIANDDINNNASDQHDEYRQQQSSTSIYGINLDSSVTHQQRYDAQWSPLRRGVVSTCSFDRKIQTHSLLSAGVKSGRAPAWLKRMSGVSTAFGGKLVSFGASYPAAINVDSVVKHPAFSKISQKFEHAISTQNYTDYCSAKAQEAFRAENVYETQVWGFMKIMFEENARVHILKYLGFDPAHISALAAAFDYDKSAADVDTSVKVMPLKAQEIIQKSLLVGDFEGAVDCCFRLGNYADALVLSSCGGPELWAKTQGEYFAKEAGKRPYLSIVSAVIHNQLDELVQRSEPRKWQETLAVLSTYAKAEEFPSLCLMLGYMLEESGEPAKASLCYMCALDINRTTEYWRSQYHAELNEDELHNLLALHKFIEKVSIFMYAPEVSRDNLSPETTNLFAMYAKALAEQGLLETASKYCFSNSQSSMELCDRLYNSTKAQGCRQIIGAAPTFPFHAVAVGVAPKRPSNETNTKNKQQQQQRQHNQVQQQQYHPRTSSDALPPGWMALQDPASGRTYYANQSTGESSWEKPMVVEQQPNPEITSGVSYGSQSTGYQQHYSHAGQQIHGAAIYEHSQTGYQQPMEPKQQTQSMRPEPVVNGSSLVAGATPQKAASKYGDGFVSSASHPELGQQYGNVGTSNPYAVEGRPGIAKVSGTPSKAPISATLDLAICSKLASQYQPVADDLLSFLAMLQACPLTLSEKKQLAEIERGVAIFTKKIARDEVDSNVIENVASMMVAIKEKQYTSAQAIQTKLVNTEWAQHKDWLKGMKFLILLIVKRL
mmetsp:Transcript_6426/g.9394  ORF Transcript_6426/g.9394 Transcript_6426/m.9394 type:complete len:1079 (-) Transcript_6426:103-3339(-)